MNENTVNENTARILRRSGRDRNGAVLLEYVLLGTVLLAFLMGAGRLLFDPSGGRAEDVTLFSRRDAMYRVVDEEQRADFGLIGNSMMDWYYRIIDTVALPVP